MSAPKLERVLPKTKCCVYLRYIGAGRQQCVGTGLCELIDGASEAPDVTVWEPIDSHIAPCDSAIRSSVEMTGAAKPASAFHVFDIQLKNSAGQSAPARCIEADYSTDEAHLNRVRLGVITPIDQALDIDGTSYHKGSIAWTELAQRTPAIVARLDSAKRATFANDLARSVLGIADRGQPFDPVNLHDLASPIREIIESGLAEIHAKRAPVSRLVQLPGSDNVLTLHWVPDIPGSPNSNVLVLGQACRRAVEVVSLTGSHPGRFDLLFAAVSDPVIVADGETGRLLDVNPATLSVYGWPRHEILKLYWDDLIAPPSDCALTHRTPTGTGVTHTYHRRADGTVFPVEAKENSFLLDGRVIVVSTIRDVTERLLAEREQLQLEARMQQAQKLESLGVLAGGIAHDFNNLLSGILGSIDLAATELVPDSSLSQSLALARQCAERASVLCDQLLAYSGRGRFVIEPVSLTTLVEELRPLLEVSLVNKPRLTFELEPSLPLIDVDAAQIRQVVLNLVMNAAESTASGSGHVIVRSSVTDVSREELSNCLLGDELPAGRYVALEVIDNGSGMDESTLSRIFEPFYTTKFAGRGLGLPALLGIVRGHRGAIHVVSNQGHGSVFRVLLPINRRRPSAAPRSSETWWIGRGCVLFADDEPPVRTVGRRFLERLGFQVVLAQNGRIAVDEFARRADEISLVILDLTMPEMTGDQALVEIRRIRPQVPIVLTSGFGEEEVLERLSNVTIDGFLKKPFRIEDFSNLVRSVLERRSVSGISPIRAVQDASVATPHTRAKVDR
jgi:PAS domain S-box-containing protein